MKRVSRREFGKTVAAAAVALPLAKLPQSGAAPTAAAPQQPAAAPEPIKPPGMDLPLTPELRQRLQNTLERDARRRALMRPSPLAYDLEPAFVFVVKRRERGPRKGA